MCTLHFPRVGYVCLKCFLSGASRVAFYGREKTVELLEPFLALPETHVQVGAVQIDDQNFVFHSSALLGQFEKIFLENRAFAVSIG